MEKLNFPKPLIFDWDTGNQEKSLIKHGTTKAEAEQAFFNTHFTSPDESHSGTEQRHHLIGISTSSKILLIVFTIRLDKIRIISARPADRQERKFYEKTLKENS